MLFIQNNCIKSGWNLALEEYLLTEFTDDIILLWRNKRAVIIGQNQNALEEINESFTRKNHIAVIRRLTGGGAVFHDLGNINFTFIRQARPQDMGDYRAFTQPVCDFLHTLGVQARLKGRNDLVIDEKKCSGNAQTVKNDRILHHGTLLFDANLEEMKGALNPSAEKLESKGIRSVKSRITNISSHLAVTISAEEFLRLLSEYFKTQVPDIEEYHLSQNDIAAVDELAEKKYNTWEWNFGASPAYNLKQAKHFPFGTVDVRLSVQDGIIQNAVFYGDFFGVSDAEELTQAIIGCRHSYDSLRTKLSGFPISSYISGMTEEDLLALLL